MGGSPLWPEITFFLGTARPDGRPHSAGLGIVWLDGDLYFTSSPRTRKARNLAQNDACTAPFSAPSEPPPPYNLDRFTFHTVFGLSTAEPEGATRWRFVRG